MRNFCKWLSAVLLTIVASVTVFSSAWAVEWRSLGPAFWEISLKGGQLIVSRDTARTSAVSGIRIRSYPFGFDGSFDSCIAWWGWRYTIPLWPIVLLLVLATIWLWWLDDFGVSRKRCLRCGYDLRARTTNICPECGSNVHAPLKGRWLGPATPRSIRTLKQGGAVISILIVAIAVTGGAHWWFEVKTDIHPTGAWVERVVRVPFWLPLAMILVPTIWLWWRGDRLIADRYT